MKVLNTLSKTLFLLTCLFVFSTPCLAAVSMGVLQGGGGLLGVDVEGSVSDKIDIQIGVGLSSFGAGVNYILTPGVSNDAISFQYINQIYTQQAVTLSYRWRGLTPGFQAHVGLGYFFARSDTFTQYFRDIINQDPPPVAMYYSIGWWF